ncbi:MAG: prephenate dehydrogenase/arogenate dehydrogenase family protein [Gammaproteobacteria bacterium]|nr:prephenate dehydrogenase/arogenate dehydrogenase family protein [Gammaproteobacteria bacterium]
MFEKLVIVGVGLLGGSLARDVKRLGLAKQVVGVCRSQATADYALQEKLLDAVQPPAEAAAGADLIIIATPMQAMLPMLAQLAPHLDPDTIVSDVGSVKQALYEQLQTELPELLTNFVLAHPIAGGEDAGVTASREGLFENKHVIITPSSEVSAEKIASVETLWQALGAQVRRMSLAEHDAIFARTSHLPHVVAYGLVNYLGRQPDSEQLFSLAAAGFYDFTRIASSNAEMWRDICITNQAQVLSAIEGLQAELERLRLLIEQADQSALLAEFSAAKAARDSGLARRVQAQAGTESSDSGN